jgi:hypothetical protein
MTLGLFLAGLLATGINIGPSAPVKELRAGAFEWRVQDAAKGLLSARIAGWNRFLLNGLAPAIRLDGAEPTLTRCEFVPAKDGWRATYHYGRRAELTLVFLPAGNGALRLQSSLRNTSGKDMVLNAVDLQATRPAPESGASFGADAEDVQVLEQGNYWGRVVPLMRKPAVARAEPSAELAGMPEPLRHNSDFVSVAYDRSSGNAFLAGFETSERWWGRIETTAGEQGCAWRIGFDGGDLLVRKGENISFEPVLFLTGKDPWRLLELYAEAVAKRYPVTLPSAPPVSWCSWYPYRLGVTEERILETARIAAERLKPLGLRVIQIDLGWESQQLPSAFEENNQFPHGLKWLAGEVSKLGLDLGVWSAPFSISEYDPVAAQHPEWLIHDEKGGIFVQSEWFWKPHGRVFVLDLTHPGAQEYLQTKMRSLAERGVRYLKSDFIGCVSDGRAKIRHDRTIVAGGGLEAARLGAKIIRQALPDALLLDCGGPEMPGTGHWPLLYACNDTGNTGFIPTSFQEQNYQGLACHLFKNGRWGILQPSCLCVGLPGSVEDARLRATIAFLAGGQIDISDTLVSLPEDRWEILTATLPPLGITAKPVDLFDGVRGPSEYGYSKTAADGAKNVAAGKEYPPGSVWHVHVKADWDEWELVGVFNYENTLSDKEPRVSRFMIPLSLVGLPSSASLWGYEFWSRQFLGKIPGRRLNPGGYEHPGDMQDLSVGDAPGLLEIAFFGPGAKLLCLRPPRSHPWVLGTGFHLSCGFELKNVSWDDAAGTLTGEVQRPRGESGMIFFSDGGRQISSCEVDGESVIPRRTANGAWILRVVVRDTPARWKVIFTRAE